MYRPPHFAEQDRQTIIEFMQAHPFATLILNDNNKNYVTQIPVILDERDGKLYITGHVARHTDHYPALANGHEALVLFTGPHCYVSASWYSRRGQASTWNYMSVHARGTVRIMNDDETLEHVTAMTHQYEDAQAAPELAENMTTDYIKAQLKAIAGFEIAVTSLDAIFKLSQNRDDESYKTIVSHLISSNDINDISVAGELLKRRPHLFEK